MKKSLLYAVLGFVLGIAVTVIGMLNVFPKMMIFEDVSQFDFDKSVEVLEASVAEHGWKIPKVHDLQKTMAKFDKKVRPVKVIELCHPDHAGKILLESEERIVSSLMPCRVAIYEKADGKTYFSRMNSGMMAAMMGGLIADVMADASSENEVILQPLFTK
jgi:uncharacterized protein (DUF302 family)